jgi:hypothetical protein
MVSGIRRRWARAHAARSVLCAAVAWLSVAGCGGGASGPPDVGIDAGADATREAGLDAGADATREAGLDAGADAAREAGTDGGTDADPSCSEISDCVLCSTHPGCAWCGTAGYCTSIDGAAAVPLGCPRWAWVWEPSACPATWCGAARDCGDCLARDNCGWCGSTGTCMLGDGNGSFDGTCSGPQWAGGGASCPASACGEELLCGGCTQPECGWCVSTESCVPASADGTHSADGTCSGTEWIKESNSKLMTMACEQRAIPNPCAAFGPCDNCLDPHWAAAGCGWCATRGAAGLCVPRDSGFCPGDAWRSSCEADADAGVGADP